MTIEQNTNLENTERINERLNVLEIIYITAPWCGACRVQTPIVEELKSLYNVVVKDVSIQENMGWANDEGILGTPTIIVRYNIKQPDGGNAIIENKFPGPTSKDTIINFIERGR